MLSFQYNFLLVEGRRKGGGGRYITEQEVMGAKQEVMGDYKKDTGSD